MHAMWHVWERNARILYGVTCMLGIFRLFAGNWAARQDMYVYGCRDMYMYGLVIWALCGHRDIYVYVRVWARCWWFGLCAGDLGFVLVIWVVSAFRSCASHWGLVPIIRALCQSLGLVLTMGLCARASGLVPVFMNICLLCGCDPENVFNVEWK